MDDRCILCRRKMKYGDEYTSINKGIYSAHGDKDWVALIFHDECWKRIGESAGLNMTRLSEADV